MSDSEEDPGTRIPATTQSEPMGGGVATSVAMETDSPAVGGQGEGEGPKEKRTVFVSNLTPDVTDAKLKEKFSEVQSLFPSLHLLLENLGVGLILPLPLVST